MIRLSVRVRSFLGDKLNVFYTLALIPLLLIVYFGMFRVVIPMVGLLLLFLKKHELSIYKEANYTQKILGLAIVVISFLLYYILVPIFPTIPYYWGVNYALYLFGLFFMFFESAALKRAFAPIFLILAGVSSSTLVEWSKPHLYFYVPHLVSLLSSVLLGMGLRVTTTYPDLIVIYTEKGAMPLLVDWTCAGFYGVLVFSIILVVFLFEDSSSIRAKLFWGIMGILGTFAINVIRLILVLLAIYFYGIEFETTIHYYLGYILFILWLLLFLHIFSLKHVILEKFQIFQRRLFSRQL